MKVSMELRVWNYEYGIFEPLDKNWKYAAVVFRRYSQNFTEETVLFSFFDKMILFTIKRVAQGSNFAFEGSFWTVLDPGSLFNDF